MVEQEKNKAMIPAVWDPSMGWNGLIPGVSLLTDAVANFGNYRELKFINGVTYSFVDGAIQLVFLNDQSKLYKIRVASTFSNKELMPTNIDEVIQRYGPLIKMNGDELANVTYERPGLRVLCTLLDEPQIVKWLEFFEDT